MRLALDLGGGGPAGRAGFAVEGFTALAMRYAGRAAATADIRLANASDAGPPMPTYRRRPRPATSGSAGPGDRPRVGNYDHMTVLHEIGHALGLEHAHEAGRSARCRGAPSTRRNTR